MKITPLIDLVEEIIELRRHVWTGRRAGCSWMGLEPCTDETPRCWHCRAVATVASIRASEDHRLMRERGDG